MREPCAGISTYLDKPVFSTTGSRLGTVDDVLLDARSQAPHWLIIRLPGPLRRLRVVPLVLVLEVRRRLAVPLTSRALRASPRVPWRAQLTAHDELALRRYWVDH